MEYNNVIEKEQKVVYTINYSIKKYRQIPVLIEKNKFKINLYII